MMIRYYSVVPEHEKERTEEISSIEFFNDVLGSGKTISDDEVARFHERDLLIEPVFGLVFLVVFPFDGVEKLVVIFDPNVLAKQTYGLHGSSERK